MEKVGSTPWAIQPKKVEVEVKMSLTEGTPVMLSGANALPPSWE
jgi:hypothetical protein